MDRAMGAIAAHGPAKALVELIYLSMCQNCQMP